MNFHEEPCSGEKMSEKIAQLQLEEVKGAREKQQQREKECQRYFEKFCMKSWLCSSGIALYFLPCYFPVQEEELRHGDVK